MRRLIVVTFFSLVFFLFLSSVVMLYLAPSARDGPSADIRRLAELNVFQGQKTFEALTGFSVRDRRFPIWQNFYDTFKKVNYPFLPSPKVYDTVKRVRDRLTPRGR
ncbi:MAG: hypothetical protein HYX24_00555 [Candidatus Aenigmarchaeota archaeon]|nr:hypothetical protein [Candidatus Aenigmarchaeota archaeon]